MVNYIKVRAPVQCVIYNVLVQLKSANQFIRKKKYSIKLEIT